jgi:hypothetical protein
MTIEVGSFVRPGQVRVLVLFERLVQSDRERARDDRVDLIGE